MRQFALIVITLTLILSLPVHAEKASREDMDRFVKVTGLYEMLEEQKRAAMKDIVKTARRQFEANGTPKEFIKFIEPEIKKYAKDLETTFDVNFFVTAYTKLISEELSADEIRELTKYYSRGLGKKAVQVQLKIMFPWTRVMTKYADEKHLKLLKEFNAIVEKKAREFEKRR